MGFLGDYPASSEVVYLKGHNATAPCTLCGFTFNKSMDMSIYAYLTSITLNNNAYMRTQGRTESLRSLNLSEHDHKCVGTIIIDSDYMFSSNPCPFLQFASRRNDAVGSTNTINPFPLFKKDGYFQNLIAPDHLITGQFKGILTVVFIKLNNSTERDNCLLYTSPSPRDQRGSRMPSSA